LIFADAIRRLFSRGEKVAPHKDSEVEVAPKLTASMGTVANQKFG
jgi:hypothetical protein